MQFVEHRILDSARLTQLQGKSKKGVYGTHKLVNRPSVDIGVWWEMTVFRC